MKISLAVVLFISVFLSVQAFSAEDAGQKLKDLQKKMEQHQRKLRELKRFESSTLDELEKANTELLKAEADFLSQESALKQTKGSISKVTGEVSRIEAKLDRQREWMRRKLRAVHKYGNLGDAVLLLAASENFSQLMRRLQYLERLAVYERRVIEGISADLRMLNERQKELASLYVKQKSEEQRIKKTVADISERKERKGILLASIKKEKVLYEQMIKEMEEASKRLMEIIRKSAEEEGFAGTGFRNLKGRLPWPVEGDVALPYGRQKDQKFGTTVFRNGVYIKTPLAVSVRSVSDGKVVFADWFKGYGQLVIVDHGEGYHSLYANLAEIFLKVGAIIKKGSEMGRVGESIMLNAPSLYFEIRYKGKPLDPAQWLKTR